MIAQGAKIPSCPSDPIGQGRSIQLDALPGIDLRLPVKRQMIGVLGDQHLGDQHLRDQRLGRNAAFDDPCRGPGLDDRALTGAAP